MSPITPSSFRFWLLTARPGEELIYHVGNLMADRLYVAEDAKGNPELRPIESVDALAAEVWRAYEEGEVNLFQFRQSWSGELCYVAQKRRRPDVAKEAA